jgi:alkanesulfonate monooxygenase SsuD/methylene tetrahydromethanopterin reductase-like flavin-dependent oxidoreductase (luciferase family)
MKFCFFNFMPYTDIERTSDGWPVSTRTFDARRASELYRTYVDMMVFAEECGFDWIGVNEHHFSPYSLMPNCNVMAGALVYPTKNVKIAILGNLVPLANPIRVAEEYAMLDCMSGGRMIAGLMRGIPHEYLAYNIPPSESWERQKEAVALIVKAWTEPEPFGWEGKHFQYKQISIWPKPFQKPHPPLVMSASNPDSARYAAEAGASMGIVRLTDFESARESIRVYQETARQHGWEPTADNILVGTYMCVADSDDEARAALGPAFDYFTNVLGGATRNAQRLVLQETRYHGADQAAKTASRLGLRDSFSLDDAIENGSVICGSPETVVKQINRIHAELGNGVLNLPMKLGNISDGVVFHGMELFRDRVLPHVRGLGVESEGSVRVAG